MSFDFIGGPSVPGQDRDGQPVPKRPSAFDLVTKLVLPVVLVFIANLQEQRARFWVLIGFALLSFVVSFYPLAASWTKTRMQRRRDERTARQAFGELREFVEQFGEFISRQRCDTLHYVVQSEVCGGDQNRFNKFGLPNINVFEPCLYSLRERCALQKPSLWDFKATNTELTMLVSTYNNYCMNAVFGLFPQDLRSQLTERSKSSLEACRECFVTFLSDYTKYLKRFDEAFAARYLLARGFPGPKPL